MNTVLIAQSRLFGTDLLHHGSACIRIKKTLYYRRHHGGIARVNDRTAVARRYLDRRMKGRSRGPPYEQRYPESASFHQTGHVTHLVKRRSDKSAESHEVGILLDGTRHDILTGHHDPHIDHVNPVATHYHTHYVLAYIMYIALNGGYDHAPRRRHPRTALLRFYKGSKPCHGLLHRTGALYHLRQKQFSFAKQVTDSVHTGHKRTVNHTHRRSALFHSLVKITLHAFINTGDKHAFYSVGSAYILISHRCGFTAGDFFVFQFFGLGNQAVGSLGIGVEQHIVDSLA